MITGTGSYYDGSDEESPEAGAALSQWPQEGGYGAHTQPAGRKERAAAAAARAAATGCSWGGGGNAAAHAAAGHQAEGPALEDWEEAELALLSPESQKRERRRIANRDCARRIRQRQTVRVAWAAVAGCRHAAAARRAPEGRQEPHLFCHAL